MIHFIIHICAIWQYVAATFYLLSQWKAWFPGITEHQQVEVFLVGSVLIVSMCRRQLETFAARLCDNLIVFSLSYPFRLKGLL